MTQIANASIAEACQQGTLIDAKALAEGGSRTTLAPKVAETDLATNGERDQIFEAIEQHRASNKAFNDFCKMYDDPGETEGYDELDEREKADWERICEMEPTTLPGAAAMARYVADFTAKDGILHDSDVLAALESLALSLERIVEVRWSPKPGQAAKLGSP